MGWKHQPRRDDHGRYNGRYSVRGDVEVAASSPRYDLWRLRGELFLVLLDISPWT